jgi:WD40 repeat protein
MRNSARRRAIFVAIEMNILILARLTSAIASEQGQAPSELEVIKLVEKPQVCRIYDLRFSPTNLSDVCAFALEQSVQVWDVSTKPRLITTLTPPVPSNMRRPGLIELPHPIAFSDDGAELAIGYFGIQIWDVDRRKLRFAVPITYTPEDIRLSGKDRTLVVASSFEGFFNVSGIEPPGRIELIPRHEYERKLVTDMKRFETDSSLSWRKRPIFSPRETRNIYCLSIYPGGKRLVAGGDSVFVDTAHDKLTHPFVTVWDVTTGRRLFTIGDKETPIVRFCLSPDGRALYTCGSKVLGWDATKSAAPTRKFDPSGRHMISLTVSPDGAMLAAGGLDGTISIWDVESAKPLATLLHRGGPVYGIAFSPASRKLVAAGENGIASVWDVKVTLNKRR